MNRDDIDLSSHVGIDPDRLGEDVRSHLEEFIANREQRLRELRERAIDAEQEARVLRDRVQSLQERLGTIEDRADGSSTMDLEPSRLLSTFGEALSSESVQRSNFTVSDINVNLRANVVSTEEGVRVTLPQPGIQPSMGTLSDLQFTVRSDPSTADLDLEEVPDLIGMAEKTAVKALTDTGFEVGSVTTVATDGEVDRVVDQLHSPFSLAEHGAPIDLEVGEQRSPEMADLIGHPLSDAVRFADDRFTLRDITAIESEEPPGTVVDQEPEPGTGVEDREGLSLTISEFRSPQRSTEELDSETEEKDEPTDGSEKTADIEDIEAPEGVDEGTTRPERGGSSSDTDGEEVAESEEESIEGHDVTEINGIGDTYGRRLRDAGIGNLADLAVAEPGEVADAANVSRDRATNWVEAVRTRIRSRADVETGEEGDETAEEDPR